MDGICTGGGDLCVDLILLDFGEVEQLESRQASFTLTNAGDADLTVESVQLTAGTSGAFSLVDLPSTPYFLAPQQTLIIEVRFAPTEKGLHTGQVDIYSDDPAADPESHLSGSVALAGMSPAMTCRLVADPDSLRFADVPIGAGQVQTVRFDNQGNAACTLETVMIQQESPPDAYSLAGMPDLLATIEPGASCDVEVQYAPGDVAEDTGALELRGSGPEPFFVGVSLAGNGIVPPTCSLVLDPMITVFPRVETGFSATQFVTLRNVGDAPCLVESVLLGQTPMQEISYAGDFEFAVEPAVPFTVEPDGQIGDQVEIEVAFVPQQSGTHASTLWVHTPDMAEQIPGQPGCMNPQTGQLAGPGDGCADVRGFTFEVDVETIPSSLDFGVVTLGCNSVEMQASLYNRSRDPLTINDIVLADPSDVDFEIRQAPPTPVFLGPGDAADVTLRFTPQASGTHSNALHLVADTGGPLVEVVDLAGHATADTEQTDLFVQEDQVMTDILFVIDNSGSMDTAQASLIDNFPAFIGWAASTNADYHIGVIATEINDAESGMGSPPRDILPGVLVQAPGRPKILTNATADLTAAFTDNANLGTCCSDEQEAGLQAAWMALSAPWRTIRMRMLVSFAREPDSTSSSSPTSRTSRLEARKAIFKPSVPSRVRRPPC